MMEKRCRAALYIRISTETQAQGYSPQFQLADGQRLAATLGDPDPIVLSDTASGPRLQASR